MAVQCLMTKGPAPAGHHRSSWHACKPHNGPLRNRGIVKGQPDSKQPGFGGALLDFMIAGKKLRKWYGAEDLSLVKDEEEGPEPQDRSAGNAPPPSIIQRLSPETILVMDVDSDPVAELCLLQLILTRAEVAACANDESAARRGFGDYVTVVSREEAGRAAARCAVAVATSATAVQRMVASCAESDRLPHIIALRVAPGPKGGLAQLRPWQRADRRDPEALLRDAGVASFSVMSVGSMSASIGPQARNAVELQWQPVTGDDVMGAPANVTAMQAAALLAKLASSRTRGSGVELGVAVIP